MITKTKISSNHILIYFSQLLKRNHLSFGSISEQELGLGIEELRIGLGIVMVLFNNPFGALRSYEYQLHVLT